MKRVTGVRKGPSKEVPGEWGVLATRDFQRGDVVGVFRGKPYTRGDETYVIHVLDEDGGTVESRRGTGVLRFLNHPNQRGGDNVQLDPESWTFRASRPIRRGEELLWDYGAPEQW